jgi:hypothetical protein
VFPFEAGAYSAFSRSFGIFGGGMPELDTVNLEHPLNSVFLRDGVHIDEYAKMFERLAELACIEIATGPDGLIHIRESDAPDVVAVTTPAKWGAFVKGIRAGEFDHL